MSAFVVLVGLAWGSVALWAVGAALTLRGLLRQRPLEPASDASLTGADAPLVSVLVPARNEEHRVLEESVRSMLGQDYGRFEVVAVNDRSTDATGPVLRALAAEDVRLRVVEGVEPPPGWLGKPNAMRQALDAARGQWVLATDADMIFEPRALRTAVRLALLGRFDAVTLLPEVVCLTFWERVFMPTFGWFMLMARPLERVNDPRRRESLGIGGFFLIRRASLERVGGYEAVRDEVAEDLSLADLLKGSGARLRVENGRRLARTRMHPTFRDIWENFSRNLFAGARFSLWQTALGAASVLLFSVAPSLVALACALALAAGVGSAAWGQLLAPALLVYLLQVLTFAPVLREWGIPRAYAFTVPLGHALFVAILANSALRIAAGRGVSWKGRRLYERAGVRPPRGQRRGP
ncbi:MAG TPA: glycosyltransferase family 2 protein [Pyrinomonadaceae bacterium]|nr:glycosyltransferase family 2 protein [Pyrinomonadaceae bacterium]